jgi:hypothetical protein
LVFVDFVQGNSPGFDVSVDFGDFDMDFAAEVAVGAIAGDEILCANHRRRIPFGLCVLVKSSTICTGGAASDFGTVVDADVVTFVGQHVVLFALPVLLHFAVFVLPREVEIGWVSSVTDVVADHVHRRFPTAGLWAWVLSSCRIISRLCVCGASAFVPLALMS